MIDEKVREERSECIKAFDINFDNDLNTVGESLIILALDITEAQVIAHEACGELNKLLEREDLRVKGVQEQCFVVAPEYGLKIETWLARLKKAIDAND